MAESIAFALGRTYAKYPLFFAGVAALGAFGIVKACATAQPTPPPPKTPVVSTQQVTSRDVEGIPERIRRCTDNWPAMRTAADELLRKKKPEASRHSFAECIPFWRTGEQVAFVAKVDAAVDIERQKARKEAERADLQRRKRQGVTIGMSEDDVLKSNWGRPQKINASHYATGTHEQWVYGNGNYLYFRDGVLTSIQNSR